jgi:hypothetical protein
VAAFGWLRDELRAQRQGAIAAPARVVIRNRRCASAGALQRELVLCWRNVAGDRGCRPSAGQRAAIPTCARCVRDVALARMASFMNSPEFGR